MEKVFATGLLVWGVAFAATPDSPVRWIHQLAGSDSNTVAGMATDTGGNIYVAGTTTSVDLPVLSAFQPRPASSALVRIDPPGNAAPGNAGSGNGWTNLYQPGATAVKAIKAAPSSPGTVYAITATGIVRTNDNGAHWTTLANSLGVPNDIAVDPSNSSIVYATVRSDVWKSIDAGATFQIVNNTELPNTNGVWTDPAAPQVVFVSSSKGVQRSADGGISWRVTYNLGANSLAFDPFAAGVLYLAYNGTAARSIDDGVTWTPLNVSEFTPHNIVADPKHRGVLYATSPFGTSIFESPDSGATWQATAAVLPGVASAIAADPVTGALYASVTLSPQPQFLSVPIANGKPRGYQIVASNDGFNSLAPVGPPTLAQVTSFAISNSSLFAGTQASPDIYVAKFDGSGRAVYLTYFGGSGVDTASAMTVDASGAVYVVGATTSQNLPVTPGAFASTGQTFLVKLSPDGSLAWSTYFTDSLTTPGNLAADSAGRLVVTGSTFGDLPVTPGVYRSKTNSAAFCAFPIGCVGASSDYFVTEFNSNGSLVFSTYFDGSGGVALASDGSAILASDTKISRFSADGSTVKATSPPLGPAGAIAIAPDGSIYAAGNVQSQYASFPSTPGAFQPSPVAVPNLPGGIAGSSGANGFIAKLDPNLNIIAATLYGGESVTTVGSLALAKDASVLIGGGTSSYGLPQKNTIWAPFSNNTGYIAQLSPDLSALKFSTFAGDADGFAVRSVAYGADGSILLAGSTLSGVPASFLDAIAPSAKTLQIDSAVNAASHLEVPVSPGETIELRGAGFSPRSSILLNGAALPASFLSSSRITAVIPSDLNAAYAVLEVGDNSSTSNSLLLPVALVSPGIFSQDGTGFGQGYILNQDGTLNSPANPAAEGSPITICATGVGTMTFVGPYAVTDSPVNVYIDGFYANGIAAFFGPVEGLPGNVYRISVYVPRPSDNAASNPNLKDFQMPPLVSVRLNVNGVNSQVGLALAVKPQ